MLRLFSIYCTTLLFLAFCTKNVILHQCNVEYTPIICANATLTLKWDAPSSENGLIISQPACLDEQGRYFLRECRNGTWSPSSDKIQCASVKFASPHCAQHQMEFGGKCVEITKAQRFHDACPSYAVKYYNYSYINSNATFWLPIQQVNSSFVYTAIDCWYGIEFEVLTPQNKDCFTRDSQSVSSVRCETKHYQMCMVKPPQPRRSLFSSSISLELKFDKRHERIYLNIYSPQNLMQMLDADDDAIYCFTDASIHELKTSVKRRLIYSSLDNKRLIRYGGEAYNVYQINLKHQFPGQYWCEAFDYNQRAVKSNKIVASRRQLGNEFVLKLTLHRIYNSSDSHSTLFIADRIYKFLDAIHFKETFLDINLVVRVMEIKMNATGASMDAVLHLSTLHHVGVVAEYHKLRECINRLPRNVTLIYFRSAEFCMPQRDGDGDNALSWRLTALGAQSTPRQLCVDAYGLPIRRKCLGSFIYGAYWSNNVKPCKNTTNLSRRTKQLYNLINTRNITKQMKNLTHNCDDFTPLDLYLVASTLRNTTALSSDANLIDDLAETVNNLMEAKLDVLKDSQMFLNATDTILDGIDLLLQNRSAKLTDQVVLVKKDKFLVQITKPFLSNVSGLALYKDDTVRSMKMNESVNFDNELDLLIHLPFELLNNLDDDKANRLNITIITSVFYDDRLFNSLGGDNKTLGKVVSVRIPNYGVFLSEPIRLLFHNADVNNADAQCAFWKYGVDSPEQFGYWSLKGGETQHINADNYYSQCVFTHLTHFALLITSQKIAINEDDDALYGDNDDCSNNINDVHDFILSCITIIGCVLSLLGLMGIFLTAMCFKKWRAKAGSKILLQLSITIALELIVVHIADSDLLPSKLLACNIVGICLHYVVLAKFSWMFVSAVLQYIRFVRIFTVLPPRLVLKAMIFGWCLPLIPVICVAFLQPDNYNQGAQKFCYPNGLPLYLGLFTPVVCIVVANFIAFVLIMHNVLHQQFEHSKTKQSQRLQVYLAILLFFMLGIPWLFGILAELVQKRSIFRLIFIYLFCLTATLQGCVIFIFYVILDKETFRLWCNLITSNK